MDVKSGRKIQDRTARQAALSYCLDEIRRLDRERYWCLLFTETAIRWRLAALYAFHLEIARTREVVTEALLGEMRLQWWRDTLKDIYNGNIKQHQVVSLLAEAIGASGIEAAPFLDLIAARETDLQTTPFTDMPAMMAYAAKTGGGLLQVASRIVTESTVSDTALEAAHNIGTAYAVTGLLRRSVFDAGSRRLLLPSAALQAQNVAPDDFFRGRADAGVCAVVAEIAEAAEDLLVSGRQQLQSLPRKERRLYLIHVLTHRHLARLRRAGYNPFLPGFAETTQNPLPDILALCTAAVRGK